MILRVGTIDGKVHTSDHIPDSQIQEYLDANDGVIGTGPFAEMKIETVEEFAKVMCKFAINDLPNKMDTTNFSITIGNRSRYFRPDSIAWAEAELDSNEG